MSNFIQVDKEEKKFLNLDACVTIEKINFMNETKPVYHIVTIADETVVVRSHIDLKDKIK